MTTKRLSHKIVLAAPFLTAALLLPVWAEGTSDYSRVEICNRSNSEAHVIFFHEDVLYRSRWILDGWYQVKKDECIGGPLVPKGLSYYYANNTDKLRWEGEARYFCTSSRPVNREVFPDEKCIQGETLRGFIEKKISDDTTKITLTGKSPEVAETEDPAFVEVVPKGNKKSGLLGWFKGDSISPDASALTDDAIETVVAEPKPKVKKKPVIKDTPAAVLETTPQKWAWAKGGLFDSENSGDDPGMKRCRRDGKKVQDAYWSTEDGSVWRSSVCAKSKAKPGTDNVYKVKDLFSYWALNKQKQPVYFIFDW